MENPFSGQERCLEEERKAQAVVSQPVPAYMLEYYREHPVLKEYPFQEQYFDYTRNHPALAGTQYLNGQISYDLV